MSSPTLFIDRDATLVEEPADEPTDALNKVHFMPGVFAALTRLTRAGFRLVMVSSDNSPGTSHLPFKAFEQVQAFLIEAFASQGIRFDAVLICPHSAAEECTCQIPKTALVDDYVRHHAIDLSRSAAIGDRASDLEFACNLGVRALRVRRDGPPEASWSALAQSLLARHAEVVRETQETRIYVSVNLDSPAPLEAQTGIGFFDHMLKNLAQHAGFSLDLTCQGDLEVDEHHTVEDCALALGEALRKALGAKHGIGRYGFVLPMDEAQAAIAVDLSGRPFAKFEGYFNREAVGGLPTELVPHFFRSLSESLGAAIHVSVKGENTHHMIEACFKGVGRSLRQALRREGSEVPSTKGSL